VAHSDYIHYKLDLLSSTSNERLIYSTEEVTPPPHPESTTPNILFSSSSSISLPDDNSLSFTNKMPASGSLEELKSRLCLREHLSKDECDRALLPTLEHASLVHSHIHHPSMDSTASPDTFEQTRNAIIYISLVVVVYIMVVLWLVSANFRASVSSVAGSGNSLARGVIRHVVNSRNNPSGMRKESSSSPCISGIRSEQGIINYNITEDSDDEELEALLVVRDKGKGTRADVSTNLDQEEDDGDLV